MLRTVFVLGAGASADAGLPVMSDFLDRAEDFYNNGSFGDKEKRDFEAVSEAVHAVKGASYNSALDLNNIETVFSAVDMGRLIGRFGVLTSEGINNLYSSIVRLIGATIDHSTRLKLSGQDFKLTGTYHKFINFLLEKFHSGNDWMASIITFNYDVALEYALHYKGIYPDYHLTDQSREESLALLKLHGSVNWSQSEDGNRISPINLSAFLSRVGFVGAGKSRKLIVAEHIDKPRGENYKYSNKPVIIPPSWNKSEHYNSLRPVWRKAAEVLGNAQAIYVIGFSLPETDMFFKYLFALGTYTRSIIRRFWVFDPDVGVDSRFKKMLAPGLKDGTRYVFHDKKFIEALRFLRTAVN